MARIAKIDNVAKKRFTRQEKKRSIGSKIRRLYFLIVCEGEKTEPNYFRQLKRSLPPGTVDVQMEVEGAARNTNSLVEYTKRHLEKSTQKYDRVWVVFDRDSFTEANFNDAIQNAKNNNIQTAWSNEAFELWFLLHFEYISTHMSRTDYKGFLEKQLTQRLGKVYKYQKNDLNTHKLITTHGNQEQAIKWAKKLEKEHGCTRYAIHNPCTKVYQLIEELENPESVWIMINTEDHQNA